MTEAEKLKKRREYQREYYKNYRKGKRALEYICNLEQTKKHRVKLIQKITSCFLVTVCLACLSACTNEPKKLYQSESVEVIRNGNITVISDLIADKEYSFHSVRLKRSEGILKPYKSIDTDTINIETMPSGFRIYDKTAKKIIYISNNKFTQ